MDQHLKFKVPFTEIVVAPTGAGKTVLMRRCIKNWRELFHFKDSGDRPEKLRVLWMYGVWQDLYNEPISSDTNIIYLKGFHPIEEIIKYKPHLLIIDDLMNQIGNDKGMADLFTRESHHRGISVVFISQNVFPKGSKMTDISRNAQYVIFMKNVRGRRSIKDFASQVFPDDMKFFMDAFNDATNVPFGYLLLDLTPTCPEDLRLRTRITSEEVSQFGVKFKPIIYIPKKRMIKEKHMGGRVKQGHPSELKK
jgi:hypothetical protein